MITKSEIEKMGSDNLSVFGGTYKGGIYLQQVPDEIAPCINDIIKSKMKIENFLEIGSAGGGSVYLFNYVFGLKNIVIIDDNKHGKHKFRSKILEEIKGNVFEFIGNSQTSEIINQVKELKMKFDIILIDGDHSYNGITLDIKNYKPFLNDNGYLFFHDIAGYKHIEDIIEELDNRGSYKIINKYISKTHSRPCGIGLLQKIKSK